VLTPGQQLRTVREQLGLTMREVEVASARLAAKHNNADFVIALSRLSDIETKGVVPNIFRVYSLAAIYRRDLHEILSWYGVETGQLASDVNIAGPRKSHLAEAVLGTTEVRIPVRLDPAFDPRRTTNLGRMIEQWGVVPLAHLSQFSNTNYAYAYLGSEDWTMYPILLPGSFLQVDESRNTVQTGMWRSEYQRPIYFVETRAGYTCGWCTLERGSLVLHPHPLSPESVRTFRHPSEAEIIGQVVGIAMRLIEGPACENGAGMETAAS
jgi:transcriptional regulator with XRE-family HTH domain